MIPVALMLDPSTVALLSLFLSLVMGAFTIYTFRQKASHEEVERLKSRVRELEAELTTSERERNRLARENYTLMADLLANKRNP